jgi:hypothetical protein
VQKDPAGRRKISSFGQNQHSGKINQAINQQAINQAQINQAQIIRANIFFPGDSL